MVNVFTHKIKQNAVLAFVLGLTSMVSQIVLLRELIIIFYGNETAYAVILASWLFWIAVGSLLAGIFSKKINNDSFWLNLFFILIFFILPICVIVIRLTKSLMGIQTGEILGIIPICVISFLVLAPLTILLGGIFALLCHLPHTPGKGNPPQTSLAGKVYLWESLGAASGGILFSFILVRFMPAMQIAFLAGFVGIVTATLTLKTGKRSVKISLAFLACILMLCSTRLIDKLDKLTRQVQWKGFEIVAIVDSPYGNITLTKIKDEYSLFENGLLSYSTKDELTAEENTHYALLEHPGPKEVLLIGNGIGGSLKEILKHPVIRTDYVELDPGVIRLSQKYIPEENLLPLKDSRVHIIYSDARLIVKRAQEKYDVIIVNLGDPYTALINRYYSLEFFKEASRILNDNGIIALSVSSAEDYLSPQAQKFLRSIYTTLRNVFPDVISIPGETNIFLACKSSNILTYNIPTLVNRLRTRGIKTQFVNEYYLPAKLTEDRVSYIKSILKIDGNLNTDMKPVVYFYDIVLWSTHFNTIFKQAMEKIEWIKLKHLMILPIILLAAGLLLRKRSPASPVVISIINTGLSQIIVQLIIILSFQTLYGYIYYKIGLMMAAFMGGLAWGSFTAGKIIIKFSGNLKEIYKVYRQSQIVTTLYPLALLATLIFLKQSPRLPQEEIFVAAFALLPVVAGFLGGLQYPLATHLLWGSSERKSESLASFAGGLYAADTLGATLGSLLTGTILIPLLGITSLGLFCAALNAAVLILLLLSSYPAK
ncbi:MAG TPA: fused MFS/spermidine synthase [Candidatus Omnitrophota bacterium]|nr:fused MFS/spermidine synthase [Candidatus Omnitrophota bacterium]HPD84449.1 fused MFS/spermidine synthase [Candidatus Omnitrophota bacterium]HRZ03307.1 fused MFS/spermidine synthase [Candidatus Omnitrophota bacterium]